MPEIQRESLKNPVKDVLMHSLLKLSQGILILTHWGLCLSNTKVTTPIAGVDLEFGKWDGCTLLKS